jgi:hypothetical protein
VRDFIVAHRPAFSDLTLRLWQRLADQWASTSEMSIISTAFDIVPSGATAMFGQMKRWSANI